MEDIPLTWGILSEGAGSMLNFILDNEKVFLINKGAVDGWGIQSASDTRTEFKCSIRGAEDSTPIEAKGGKQVIPSYVVSFNGKVPFGVGDTLEVEGNKLVVLHKKEVKDLSRAVMFTKVTL